MHENEQVVHFGDELDKLVCRFRKEYDISYAALVGTLQMKSHLLLTEAANLNDEEDRD